MIILDTNIISELMKKTPNQQVMNWFDALSSQPIATTAITVAEIHFGLTNMGKGKRQENLTALFQTVLREDFSGYVLPFDQNAAKAYGLLAARLRKKGTPIGQSDTMIAAISMLHDAVLVTRNDKHFKHCGIDIANPFNA